MKANTPYVKKYDQFGVLTNPITKENPYLFSPVKNLIRFQYSKFRRWQVEKNKFFIGKVITW